MSTRTEAQAFANLDDYHQVIHNAIDLTYHELMCTLEALYERNVMWLERSVPHADAERTRKIDAALQMAMTPGFEGKWALYRSTRIPKLTERFTTSSLRAMNNLGVDPTEPRA